MQQKTSFLSTFRPTRRFLGLVWFPLFFLAAFSSMFVINVGHARPNGVQVGVIGTPGVVAQTETTISRAQSGIVFREVADVASAKTLVGNNEIAGVLNMTDPAKPTFMMAMASSGSRALYLQAMFGRALRTPVGEVNLVPTSPGDFTGVGLFFCALPLQILGMIAASVLSLSQVERWRQKFLWIGIYGAFGAIFTYVLCTSLQVIPANPMLAVLGFVLTQTVAWIATGAAAFLKQFFLPVVMPFLIIFEIPISGGPMSADMMPKFSQVLHAILPFSRYLDASRSIAYFNGTGAAKSIWILFGWMIVGLALMVAGIWWTRREDRLKAIHLEHLAVAHNPPSAKANSPAGDTTQAPGPRLRRTNFVSEPPVPATTKPAKSAPTPSGPEAAGSGTEPHQATSGTAQAHATKSLAEPIPAPIPAPSLADEQASAEMSTGAKDQAETPTSTPNEEHTQMNATATPAKSAGTADADECKLE